MFICWMRFLTPNQWCQSTEGLFVHYKKTEKRKPSPWLFSSLLNCKVIFNTLKKTALGQTWCLGMVRVGGFLYVQRRVWPQAEQERRWSAARQEREQWSRQSLPSISAAAAAAATPSLLSVSHTHKHQLSSSSASTHNCNITNEIHIIMLAASSSKRNGSVRCLSMHVVYTPVTHPMAAPIRPAHISALEPECQYTSL